MTIAQVVTFGFGAFGSVNKLPTFGFDVSAVVVPTAEGLEFTLPESRIHFTMKDDKLHFTVEK